MPTVYIETSIVSYLRQLPSSQIVMAARQVLTHQWWNDERANYELVTSQYVIDEASAGSALRKRWWAMIQKHNSDSIIDEIHRIRHEISEKFGGDIAAIAEDARQRQAASGRPVWKRKPSTGATRPTKNA